jgi:hypothetical protein
MGLEVNGSIQLPEEVRLGFSELGGGLHLLDNGVMHLLRVGNACPANIVQDLFGVTQPQAGMTLQYPAEGDTNSMRARVYNILEALRAGAYRRQVLNVVIEGTPADVAFQALLIEDKSGGVLSLSEFQALIG